MPRISNILPLPGVYELESLARGFSNRLKDAGFENDQSAALARRLECLIERAKLLEDPSKLISQLLDIQRQFQTADASTFRLGIRSAQRKLALWDDLSTKLDKMMEVGTVDLMAQMQQVQTQMMQIQHLQANYANTHSRQYKVKIIDGYDIINQVEIPRKNPPIRPPETIKTTLRAGRFGRLPVVYATFVSDSRDAAHGLVKQEVDRIAQLLHVNIAQLVGATKGSKGLNGIIVVMDGIDINDFWRQTHSGAAWAKSISDIYAFRTSFPKLVLVRRITVAPDGHITVFPFGSIASQSEGISDKVLLWSRDATDVAVRLLFDVLIYNGLKLGSSSIRTFVDSLTELRPEFTKLQLMKLAGSSRLFPPIRSLHFDDICEPIYPSQPEVGEFGRATYHNGNLNGWESLGMSRYSRNKNRNHRSWFSASPDLGRSLPSRRNRWLTCILRYSSRFGSGMYFGAESSWRFSWEDVTKEAQEISQHLNIDLDSIALCSDISYRITLKCPEDPRWREVPQTLYYHRSPSSPDPREIKGFLSSSEVPDCGEWEDLLEQHGGCFVSRVKFATYCMGDDWSRQYERELLKSISTMPGSYPQYAHIDA